MRAPSVLHVDTGLTWRGGQQQVLFLHRGLLRRGIESHLVCSSGGELLARAQAEGLPVTGLALRGEWDLASAWRIASALRISGATHLHLHSSHAQTLGLLGSAWSGIRNVVVTRRVDFIPGRHLFNRWKYGPRVARFVAISRAIQDILIGIGVPSERIRLVPSGVELNRGTPGEGRGFREELGLAEDQPLIGNIGHLADHKGQRYLVEAVPLVLRDFPRAKFVIVGHGELEVELKARADALGLGGHLFFAGFRRDMAAILDALDVFVLPSHLEGLGTVVLEALAARKPVVATRTGGVPDIIEDGREGLLVPSRDPKALASALSRLLSDSELARTLAEEGHRKVEQNFSVDRMVEGNLELYWELAGVEAKL